jgi:hypothetical protein
LIPILRLIYNRRCIGTSVNSEKIANAVNSSFSFSKYVGTMVAIAWTLGWLVGAACATKYWMAPGSTGALVNLVLTLLPVAFGMWMTFRVFPREDRPQAIQPPDSSPPEPWYRRITGGIGLVVWCVVAVIWNLTVFNVVAHGAMKGQTLNIVIMIPFSAIGMLLLFVLFTAIAMLFDSVCQIEDKTMPSAASEPVLPPPARQPEQHVEDSSAKSNLGLEEMPIHGALLILSWFNWFVYMAFNLYWGGDAAGTLPSRDGFILTSHGHHTTVSETVWVISLFYGAATLLGTPAIWISFGVRYLWEHRKEDIWRKRGAWYKKAGIGLFITLWCIGWFGVGGHTFLQSYTDWKSLKHLPATQQSRQPSTNAGVAAKP